jgi:hypothetical protein
MATALRDELLAIPGIAQAEVEGDSVVAGVRVQLELGADPDEVGAAVRRILSAHGMRPVLGEDDEAATVPGPPPPPGAPGSVVSFPLVGERAGNADVAVPRPVPLPAPVPRLERVVIEEGAFGIELRLVTVDGSSASRRLPPGSSGLDAAVVSAAGELLDSSGVALIDVHEQLIEGEPVLTVVVAGGDGARVAGAALQSGGRPFAVARATWLALRSLAERA